MADGDDVVSACICSLEELDEQEELEFVLQEVKSARTYEMRARELFGALETAGLLEIDSLLATQLRVAGHTHMKDIHTVGHHRLSGTTTTMLFSRKKHPPVEFVFTNYFEPDVILSCVVMNAAQEHLGFREEWSLTFNSKIDSEMSYVIVAHGDRSFHGDKFGAVSLDKAAWAKACRKLHVDVGGQDSEGTLLKMVLFLARCECSKCACKVWSLTEGHDAEEDARWVWEHVDKVIGTPSIVDQATTMKKRRHDVPDGRNKRKQGRR